MKSNLRIGILSAVLLVLFAPKAVDAKILSGNGTNAGGTGDSCATYGAGTYAWDSSHLAWYEFKYVDGISDDTTATVYSSTGLGPGGSITIEKDGESCAKYSDTFYLAGYVPYICGTGAMSGSQNWERVNHGTYYYTAGQPIGFPAGGGSFIITDSDSGLPSGSGYPAYSGSTVVAWGKTVKESVALKAWQDLDPSNAGATQVPDSWFCGGEKEDPKQEGYFTGSAKIQIKENGKVVKENGSTTSSPTYTIYGTGKKTINFTASGAVAADTSKNNTLASNIVRYTTPPNWTLSTKGYSDNKATATASKDSSLEMNPGDKMTVCAKNTYHSHYKSETGGWTNEAPSVETCIEIDYVAATYSMGTASQIVVLQNGTPKANAFSIDQNSKNTSTGDRYGNGTSTTGSINNSFGQPSSVTVSSGIKPGNIEVFALNKVTKISKSPAAAADADIKLAGLTVQNPSGNKNTGCGNGATISSALHYKDCYNAGDTTKVVYPEQTVTYTATTSVSSTISASGEASSDRVPTSASVTVTADPLTCPDFNNAQIGVNHPTNYGRIAINNATGENATNSAGNLPDGGWNNKVEKYYAPYGTPGNSSASLQLSYYACMGYQSYLDANGISNNDVTYSVSSNREDVYARTSIYKPSNMIDMRRVAGKNITAQEIGSNGLARINNKYSSGKQSTRRIDLDESFVGYTTSNTFTWNNSSFGDNRTVSIDLNVPYNYYLDDDTAPDMDEKVVFAGQSPKFKLNTVAKERINKKVEETSGYGNKYATKQLRATKRTITPVYIDSSISASEIASKSKIIVPLDATNFAYGVLAANGLTATKGAFSDGEELKSDTFNNRDNIPNTDVEFEPVEEGHIGDKLCIAVAIYPADSHNATKVIDGKVTPLINDDQSSALNGPDYKNGGEYTLISLSCATVGKKPSVSVEGGSLMTKGAIAANNTTYGGHIFGSWAEYDIVSGYSTKGIIGSGAAFAYANPQTTINASRTDGDGLESGKLKKPQSIGNTAPNDSYGDNTEAAAQVARGEGMTSSAWQFANNIYQKYIADGSASHPDLIKTDAPDGASVSGVFTGAGEEGKLYLVRSTGKLRIDSNIVNHLNNSIYVIYSEAGIDIAPGVTRIDAFLIANKNGTASSSTSGTATIDTCAGYDRDDSHGNQVLLENCNKTLVINGAVAAEKIVLDRVAGGGSYEDSEELKPESLTQRAEIFNYDMRVVFWATKMLDNEDVTNSTYVKELSPRL